MNIVLDTNIFEQDWQLSSPDFKVVRDYLYRTNSKLIMPQIVWDEIERRYTENFNQRIQKYRNTVGRLNQILFKEEDKITLNNVGSNIRDYQDFLLKTFSLNKTDFLPYKEGYLIEIVKRGINKHKPLGLKGQNFRDGLIWLKMMEFVPKTRELELFFITDNDKDFKADGSKTLHEKLVEECEKLKIKINYYESLEDWVRTISKKVEFITEDWLAKILPIQKFEKLLNEKLDNDNPDRIVYHLSKVCPTKVIGFASIFTASPYKYDKIYAYELNNNTYITHAHIYCNINVSYLSEDEISSRESTKSYTPVLMMSPLQIVVSVRIMIDKMDQSLSEIFIDSLSYYSD